MHTQLLVGVLMAWSVAYIGLALQFVAAWRLRRADFEYLLFASTNLALAVHTAGLGFSYWAAAKPHIGQHLVRVGADVATMGAIGATTLLFHFTVRYGRLRLKQFVRLAYAAALFYSLVLLGGYWWQALEVSADDISVFGLQLVSIQSVPTAVGKSFYVLAAGAILFMTATLGRLWARGRGEALGAFVGSLALSALVLHDVAIVLGWLKSVFLSGIGYFVFACGVSFTLVLRYGARSSELEVRTIDLDQKSRELELSYRALQEAQAQLVKSKQLAAVGELAAVVAHEVRNPLTIVNNAVSSLRKSSLDPEKRTTLLTIIEEEVMRLDRLVRRLLTFARPMALQRNRVSVEKLVERSLSLCDARPDITVNCALVDTERGLTGDFDLLRQALENVVSNALDAMPDGGAMSVTTQSDTLNDEDALRIEVKDTGAGMADTLLDRASQPFVTTRASGIGLGLSIVRRIVEAHGGKLEIDSTEGVGTRVACILPRVPPDEVGGEGWGIKREVA